MQSTCPWQAANAGRYARPEKADVNIEIADKQFLAVSARYSQIVYVRSGQQAHILMKPHDVCLLRCGSVPATASHR